MVVNSPKYKQKQNAKVVALFLQIMVFFRNLYKVWLSSYFSFNREFSQFSCASAKCRTSVNTNGSFVVSDI